jgi:hypothetical protein
MVSLMVRDRRPAPLGEESVRVASPNPKDIFSSSAIMIWTFDPYVHLFLSWFVLLENFRIYIVSMYY